MITDKKKVNAKKISRMGQYTSFTQSNKNERGRHSYQAVKFMDRKFIRD